MTKRGRGRPPKSESAKAATKANAKVVRRETMTNLSIAKETKREFDDIKNKLSEQIGIELTNKQVLKWLINNADI